MFSARSRLRLTFKPRLMVASHGRLIHEPQPLLCVTDEPQPFAAVRLVKIHLRWRRPIGALSRLVIRQSRNGSHWSLARMGASRLE